MSNYRSRLAPPKASAMIESLRGLGYSTATALADIIDNSISAGATRVELTFRWAGKGSIIQVLDDGAGMDDANLESAMRLGERSPRDQRAAGDLGRFGLGLKTASFSQCRRLTVASRRDGVLSCLRWDLDVLSASQDAGWHLLEGPHPGSEPLLEPLDGRTGTLVTWEVLDRIVTQGYTDQDFLDLIDRVEKHLAMVFHRFLEGMNPRLTITINEHPVAPWDPFLIGRAASSSPVDRIPTPDGPIEVQWHVLPHKDKLDPRTIEVAGGPDGWTAQQGFYVYRNLRMLVGGTWLGLGPGRPWSKEEAYRLARIRLDLPNTADEAWRIDIRKSVARPPVSVRARLTRLAEDAREHARRVFAFRGQYTKGTTSEPIAHAWKVINTEGGTRYRIDEVHPVIKDVIDNAGPMLPAIRAMLRIIEETVPVQRIWLDTTEAKETPRTGFSGEKPEEVAAVLATIFRGLVDRKGYSLEEAREKLRHTEPFQDYPDLVDALAVPAEKEIEQ